MKRTLFIICTALLSAIVFACKDKHEDSYESAEVSATTDKALCDQYHSATATATVSGDGIEDRGICWGTGELPTLKDFSKSDGIGAEGTFTLDLTDLTAGTLYYVRGYATDSSGNTAYGASLQFTTVAYLNTGIVSTMPEDELITVKAYVSDGLEDLVVTERGVYYGSGENPQTTGTRLPAVSGGKGDFEITITKLLSGTEYHIVSYAVSEEGTVYSDVVPVRTTGTASVVPTAFYEALTAAQLQYGVVRDKDTEFVMHYTFDFTDMESGDVYVTITYIEQTGNNDAIHITERVSFNAGFTEATWTSVTNDGNEFGGIALGGNDFSVIGTNGLALANGWTQGDVWKICTKKDFGGLSRVSELYPGNLHPSLASIFQSDLCSQTTMEFNGGSASIVAMPAPVDGIYLFLKNKVVDGVTYIPIHEDVAVFEFGSYNSAWDNYPEKSPLILEVLQPFLDVWYDEGGLMFIEEKITGLTLEEGGFYFYTISTQRNEWMKWRLRLSNE